MERRLGKIVLPSNFLTRGQCLPRLLGNGRGDRLRSGPDRPRETCGAAIEAWAGPRRWPELAQESKEMLLTNKVEVLIRKVRHRRRSLNSAAARAEDP